MCIDENFTKKNLNSFLMTQEVGGYNSRCFASNFRSPTSKPTILNNRCYTTLCSAKQNYLFIIISPYILVCSTPGQILNAPKGLFGTLKCPTNFSTICNAKKMCVYHCNKNGICIDGMCLCSGSLTLTATCLDNTFNSSAPGTTGGFISLTNSNSLESSARTVYGLNQKCLSGTFLNEFGDC